MADRIRVIIKPTIWPFPTGLSSWQSVAKNLKSLGEKNGEKILKQYPIVRTLLPGHPNIWKMQQMDCEQMDDLNIYNFWTFAAFGHGRLDQP